MKNSKPKLTNISNYPAGIATETIQNLVPGVKTARVVAFVKKWFRGSDNGSVGYDPQMVPKVAVGSAITLDYPFRKYASSQWVFHTTGFRSGKTETWNLWKSMLRTELTTWMDLNWQSKDPVSTTEDWLPPEEQADPEFGRSHLLSWHKAILLAAFIEHQTLMDHAFSILGQHRAQLSSTLLRAFMSANHITIGLHSPLLFTLEDSDIHALVVHIFSCYIASGGRPDVSKTTKAEMCNFKPSERHIFGVDQDVCTILCKGWRTPVQHEQMQFSARIAVRELDDDLRKNISDFFTDLLYAWDWTLHEKTIVNLSIERGEEGWETISAAISSCQDTNLIGTLMRHSLFFASTAQDFVSVDMLLATKSVKWARYDQLDYEIIQSALAFADMSPVSRRRFIDGFIYGEKLEKPRFIIPSDMRAKFEANRQLTAILEDSVERERWDIAVALYKGEARLSAALQSVNLVLGCINDRQRLQSRCFVEETSNGRVHIVYCPRHYHDRHDKDQARQRHRQCEVDGMNVSENSVPI